MKYEFRKQNGKINDWQKEKKEAWLYYVNSKIKKPVKDEDVDGTYKNMKNNLIPWMILKE